jgi:hypothetical protein
MELSARRCRCDLSVEKMTDRQQHAFTLERRERFLALLTVGKSVEEAAAIVGISRTTIVRWAARGRVPDATTEHARFAQRFDAIRLAADQESKDDDDVVADLDALDAEDPFCVLAGDPFGDAWRERTKALDRSSGGL